MRQERATDDDPIVSRLTSAVSCLIEAEARCVARIEELVSAGWQLTVADPFTQTQCEQREVSIELDTERRDRKSVV